MADRLQIDARRCLVSFKLLQFPPRTTTRAMRAPMRWVGWDGSMGGAGFLSSWLGDDNDSAQQRQGVNWGAIAGLAIAFMISGGFWAGVGVLVARVLK